MDLVRFELEFGHGRVTRGNALSQCLAEILYRVAQVKNPEGRRDLQRALGYPIDRMATCAIVDCKRPAALLGR